MKEYLDVSVHLKSGSSYKNPLMLSEVAIIKQILRQVNVVSVEVSLVETTEKEFKEIFGG